MTDLRALWLLLVELTPVLTPFLIAALLVLPATAVMVMWMRHPHGGLRCREASVQDPSP